MARLRGNQRLFWKRATAAWKCDDPSACVSCRRRPARRGEFPPASDAPRPAPAQGVLRRAREVAAGRGLACPRRIPPQSLEHRHLLDDAAPVPVQGAQECPPDVLAAHRLDVRQVGLVERVRENTGYRHQVYVPLGIARGIPQLRREMVHELRRRSLLRQRGLRRPGRVLGNAIRANLGQPEMTRQPARRGDAALPARQASTLGKLRRVDARREGRVSSRARSLQNSSRVVFAGSVSGSACITASVIAVGDSTCGGRASAAIGDPRESP